MTGRPQASEVAPYYFTYIDKAGGDDPLAAIETQLPEALSIFQGVSEDASLHRYAADKWSVRQVLNHITDTERAFAFRALWFARGFDTPLPSYDQNVSSAGARGSSAVGRACGGVSGGAAGDGLALSEHAGGRLDAKRHRQRQSVFGASARLHHRGAPDAPHEHSARTLLVAASERRPDALSRSRGATFRWPLAEWLERGACSRSGRIPSRGPPGFLLPAAVG